MPIETVQVRGLEGVLDTLQGLPREIVSNRGGPVRAALARAARLMQREVKGNLEAIVAAGNAGEDERSTGLLSANIVTSRGRQGNVNGETYRVRVRNKVYPDQKRNLKRFTTAQNARLLEYGTEQRRAYSLKVQAIADAHAAPDQLHAVSACNACSSETRGNIPSALCRLALTISAAGNAFRTDSKCFCQFAMLAQFPSGRG